MADVNATTRLLKRASEGGDSAVARLYPLVYEELRRHAEDLFRAERPNHTLQPTALVNEAFLRLVGGERITWNSRAHFFAIAARVMRRVLIDYARRVDGPEHPGQRRRVTLDDAERTTGIRNVDCLDLEKALEALAVHDHRKERVVELRFFGGLSVEQVAHVLEISKTTVEEDWRFSRAWLSERLHDGNDD